LLIALPEMIRKEGSKKMLNKSSLGNAFSTNYPKGKGHKNPKFSTFSKSI